MLRRQAELSLCKNGNTNTLCEQFKKGVEAKGHHVDLVRKKDAKKFKSEADLNKKNVRVMVKPGGTNEKFALANLPDCTLLVHQQNAEIPGLIAEGKADVMITETMEARRYTRDEARLAAPLLDDPFTRNQFGILMQKGDQEWLNYVNFFMEEKDMDGTLDKLEDQYIK